MASHSDRYAMEDLLYLMSRLRDRETGCPWDCQQDAVSLASFTLEEAYEVVDAIERHDTEHLPEELGDLLFQVIFHAQLGSESGDFDFADIVDVLTRKLVSRHPHVFPDGTLHSGRDPDQQLENTEIHAVWEQKKHQERTRKGRRGLLADIPSALPALMRAQKVQKRAARVGFDWRDVDGVLGKVREELEELSAEVLAGDLRGCEDELGDVLFTVVNLARHLNCDAETALRKATGKFERRFAAMESSAENAGLVLEDLSDTQLDALWRQVKSDRE